MLYCQSREDDDDNDDKCCIADLERINVAASPTANCPQQSITNLSNQIVMTMMMIFVMKMIHLLQSNANQIDDDTGFLESCDEQ